MLCTSEYIDARACRDKDNGDCSICNMTPDDLDVSIIAIFVHARDIFSYVIIVNLVPRTLHLRFYPAFGTVLCRTGAAGSGGLYTCVPLCQTYNTQLIPYFCIVILEQKKTC